MIFVLIGLVLGLVFLASLVIDSLDFGETVINCIGGLLVIFAFTIIGVMVGMFFGLFVPQEAIQDRVIPLATLKDNSSLNGSFFLGIGSVSSEPKYFYIERLENGGFKQSSVDAEGVTLFEDTTEPRIITYSSRAKTRWLEWIGLPVKTFAPEIHIPAGSIMKNYVVDAE